MAMLISINSQTGGEALVNLNQVRRVLSLFTVHFSSIPLIIPQRPN
jgi:hypothetical protein